MKTTTTGGHWLIQSGSQFVSRIDPMSGNVFWTSNRDEAKGFYGKPYAEEIAYRIGRVIRK